MSDDPVIVPIELAHRVLAAGPDPGAVAELLAALEALPPRELVRFDSGARGTFSGLRPDDIAALRNSGAGVRAWEVLALVSADGRERQRAAEAVRFGPLTTRLLALRATDWVAQVRSAAVARLEECPAALLIEALPLADQLAVERIRGDALHSVLDRRLGDDELRSAARAPGPRVRSAAWRRLIERGAVSGDELCEAARDQHLAVRMHALRSLDGLAADERRAVAEILVADPVGSVAAPALAALVAIDGAAPIQRGLTGRSAGVRRAARDWAAVRGIDARAVYLERLREDPRDAIALAALAEIADERDVGMFLDLLGDGRARIRAAGLRALARVDRAEARRIAVDALRAGVAGRMLWAAADVLRAGSPNPAEADALAVIALAESRPIGQRIRALSLLRRMRWRHLALLLRARAGAVDHGARLWLDHELRSWIAESGRINRGPSPELRREIDELLDTVAADQRRAIEFVLRTAV